jgi:hypothetical protein
MKVLLMNAGQDAQDHYRVREPARAVHEAGLGISVEMTAGIATVLRPPAGGGDPEVVSADARGADVVVLQLPKTVAMLQTIRVLQAQGVAVVVEMDDLLSGVPAGHAAHDVLVRQGMARRAAECAREADLVTVTTPALLAEYAPHGRGVVVPNAVPRRLAELPPAYERDPDVVTVGWTGNVRGRVHDLQEMGSGLQQALDATRGRSRFAVLGESWDVKERLLLSAEPAEVPWVHGVDAYLEAVGTCFDVGVAPLRADRYNACKSWLKPLEYAARGVPVVRSATVEYERLGLGWRARAPKDWAKALTRTIQDADRRREDAARARDAVLAGHLTEHTAERWAAAWRQARDLATRARLRCG